MKKPRRQCWQSFLSVYAKNLDLQFKYKLLIAVLHLDLPHKIIISFLIIMAAAGSIGVKTIAYQSVIGFNHIYNRGIIGIRFSFKAECFNDLQVFRLVVLSPSGSKSFRCPAELIIFFASSIFPAPVLRWSFLQICSWRCFEL